MSAARILYPPMSGRDRKHFARELRQGEYAHERLVRDAAAAHAAADRQRSEAHRIDCEAWSARQFIGGPEDPSPTIAQALDGGHELLEVRCRHCRHTELVDLAEVVWPQSRPVHTLKRALCCRPCLDGSGKAKIKRRPELVSLRPRKESPTSPAAAAR